ncbi:MMPL family transporter [Oenococcus sicerae]|uniref:MMPL family transporter n=1 Tax=Oenococcus sicerae TaxID=2203724 RepID=A0AAJ1RC14_9LACO|nr:MMPL family transporter [Oenococcus sicerae]MDN6900150.1 MMPL family transporter [Oenococcus sicerae]QAS69756.1 MMPL family transporter [Oenococcus sicerae]
MEKILKKSRIFIVAFWLIAAVIAAFALPNVDHLVQTKGQITVPKNSYIQKGTRLQKKLTPGQSSSDDIIAVFNTGSKSKLSSRQISKIRQAVKKVSKDKSTYHISSVTSLLDGKSIQKQLTSKDKTTMLVQISVKSDQSQIGNRSSKIKKAMHIKGLTLKMTGTDLVNYDFLSASQNGVKQTEIIAIIFILIVLIFVFKTPVVPLISLITVGISFIVSFSLVTNLVQHFNYPFSNFTQVFMVVVLFGIGTDYNILMYTRFKSEIAGDDDNNRSAVNTIAASGRTVLFSGSSVLIGFATLALARFSLYQATSAVAIGVLVLLLVLTTLNPALMSLFGKRLFWPSKRFSGESQSRYWHFLTSGAVKHGFINVLVIVLIAAPFAAIFSNKLNFNDLWEVSNKYESKQGVNLIQKHFPAGFSSPVTVVISSDKRLDSNTSLYDLDSIQSKLTKNKNVSEVMGVTRPLGDKINQLYVDNQLGTLNSGITKAGNGVSTINSGLKDAQNQLDKQQTNTASVQKLIDGTSQLQSGSSELQTALNTLQTKLSTGAAGAAELDSSLGTLSSSTATLKSAVDQILTGNEKIMSAVQSSAISASEIQQLEELVASLQQSYPNDPRLTALSKALSQLSSLPSSQAELISNLQKSNTALTQVDKGLGTMQTGIAQMQTGANQLSSGMQTGASGAGQIASKTQDLTKGLAQVQSGQQEMKTALNQLISKSKELKTGLGKASDGLNQVSDGLDQGQSYVSQLIGNASDWLNIPNSVLRSKTFKQSLDQYMSPDRKTTKITVILKMDPFSHSAMSATNNLRKVVSHSLQGTSLAGSKIGITGTSMKNYDLQQISTSDFLRTAIIMLIGITIVLSFITHSTLHAFMIIASLAGTYFASLGIGEKISQIFLGRDMLSWNVPFFSFIMLVALGVDYSIFVMRRFDEERGTTKERLVAASTHLGSVVISAAVILGGTFASMIPSGILTLVQVPIVVIVGLVILAFVAIPMFVPAGISDIEWLLMKHVDATKRAAHKKD